LTADNLYSNLISGEANMANKHKIVGELEVVVKEMCEKGYNATHIAKTLELAKGTVKLWAKKNGFQLNQRSSKKIQDLRPKIVEMLRNGIKRKEIQKTLNVHYTQVTKIAEEEGLLANLKNRAEASLDRIVPKEEIEKRITDGSTYLGYINDKKKYTFICPITHKVYFKSNTHIKTISSPFGKSGSVLTEADYIERLKSIEHTIEPGTFTKTKGPVVVYCHKGHKRELLKASYAFKFDCATCGNNGTSRQEQDILAWIQQYYPTATKFKFPERKTKPKEIDVFISELKLGIEFCGLHFHQENNLDEEKADENKHYKKMLEANKLGIRLITIFSDEWEDREQQIKNFLLSAIGKNEYKIGARECEVRLISKNLCDEFMEANHIQGKDNSIVSFGLFYNEEIVGAITGGTHPQRHTKGDKNLYLNRLAFKTNTTIIGGSSKLLGALVEYAKNNGFECIKSWSDNRWSEGNVYEKLGFKFESEKDKNGSRGLSDGSIWPEFQCVIKGKRVSRYTAKKMGFKDLDLRKVYDCGKKRWSYKL
jgi:predicted transcriptional regulator